MAPFRVQIIDPQGEIAKEVMVNGRDASDAAVVAAGEPLVRGEKGRRKVLRAKVYWQSGGTPTMARFYRVTSS
jgi:hypothetical protein